MHQYKTKNLPQPLATFSFPARIFTIIVLGTQQKAIITFHIFNISRAQLSFKYQVVKVWNTIPLNIKESRSLEYYTTKY